MQLHENEEKKEGENDNVVYADLDKSALGTGETQSFFKIFQISIFCSFQERDERAEQIKNQRNMLKSNLSKNESFAAQK